MMERELAAAIAARMDTDAERDMFPQVLAAAVAGAARVATKYWMLPDVDTPYASLLRTALEQVVRAAVPMPPP